MLPAAGTLGLVVQPGRGLWASMVQKTGPNHQSSIIDARKAEGRAALEMSTPEERQKILAAFEEAKRTREERKARLEKEALQALTLPEVSGGGEELEQYVERVEAERRRKAEEGTLEADEDESIISTTPVATPSELTHEDSAQVLDATVESTSEETQHFADLMLAMQQSRMFHAKDQQGSGSSD